jgi:adenine-specific DNA-methyltransferase
MEELDSQGRIAYTNTGTPNLKRYIDETLGAPVQNLWDDIPPVNPMAKERLNYPTQKPEALLERIIAASSNEGDLVLDCFCGSGTTAAVAEKLGRRWLTCDLGRFAIHTTRKRLLAIEGVKPFVVQNLGKYERQVWQRAEFGEQAETILAAYRHFILDLYHAEPIAGYVWLHGKKGGRLVHVGTVDTPITAADVQQMAIEFRKLVGSGADAPSQAGLDVLGWDFALDLNETARQVAQAAGLRVRFVRIPREVLEKKAVEQGDIAFFELAALAVETQVRRRCLTVTLTDFMVPPDDVPEAVAQAVKKWSEWIDYWAVDFNFRDDTFHNEWQAYRTRKDRRLPLTVTHEYAEPGEYTVVVKVIDILGNDTTKAIRVESRE